MELVPLSVQLVGFETDTKEMSTMENDQLVIGETKRTYVSNCPARGSWELTESKRGREANLQDAQLQNLTRR